MAGYYDVVLGLIPVTLTGISGVLVLAGFALTAAVALASVVAVGIVGHAMFVRAPVDVVPQSPTGTTDAHTGTVEFNSAD